MGKVMRALADEIALGLADELRRRKGILALPAPTARDLPVDPTAQKAIEDSDDVQAITVSEQQILLRRLRKVERTLEKIAERIRSEPAESEAESHIDGDGSKYQNVDTLLKYVDGSGAETGVKLVIMNFND